jgi:hypothetical protein
MTASFWAGDMWRRMSASWSVIAMTPSCPDGPVRGKVTRGPRARIVATVRYCPRPAARSRLPTTRRRAPPLPGGPCPVEARPGYAGGRGAGGDERDEEDEGETGAWARTGVHEAIDIGCGRGAGREVGRDLPQDPTAFPRGTEWPRPLDSYRASLADSGWRWSSP